MRTGAPPAAARGHRAHPDRGARLDQFTGRDRRTGGDRGAGTVLALSLVALVLTLTGGALVIGSAVVASHRARLAADLASLAGASAAQDGATTAACAAASQVARANGAVTQTCSVVGADVEVAVSVATSLWPAPATARSRAGPER